MSKENISNSLITDRAKLHAHLLTWLSSELPNSHLDKINKRKKVCYLSSQDDEERTEEIQALFVISLHNCDGADGVGITPTIRDPTVSEDGNNHVLFHVEGTWIQAEAPPQQLVLLLGEGGRHEFADGQHGDLHQNGRDGQGLRAVGEEGVEEYEQSARS